MQNLVVKVAEFELDIVTFLSVRLWILSMNRYSVVELRSVLPTLLFSCAISINLQILYISLYFFSFPIRLHGMLMVIKLIVYSIDYPGSERDSNWEYHSEMDVILDKTFVPCFYERMSMLFLLGYPCCVKGGNFGLFVFWYYCLEV